MSNGIMDAMSIISSFKLKLLGSKTLGTKCIRTSICNVLANHNQNIESRFRLAQCVFTCKIGIE